MKYNCWVGRVVFSFCRDYGTTTTPMYMADWIQRLDVILQLNGRENKSRKCLE
jgi:hypothetical protein